MSPPTGQTRVARPRDRSAVLALAGRLTVGIAPWRDAERWAEVSRGWVQEALVAADGERSQVFVVTGVDGRVAGFVSVGTRTHVTGATDGYVGGSSSPPGPRAAGPAGR